jgi:hypothetical protein
LSEVVVGVRTVAEGEAEQDLGGVGEHLFVLKEGHDLLEPGCPVLLLLKEVVLEPDAHTTTTAQ